MSGCRTIMLASACLLGLLALGRPSPATAQVKDELGSRDCSVNTWYREHNLSNQAMDIWSIVTDNNGPGSPAIGPLVHVGVVPAHGVGIGVINAGTYNSKNCDLINIMLPVGGRAGANNPPGNNGVPPIAGLPNNDNGLTTFFLENIFKDPTTGLWIVGSVSDYLALAGLANLLLDFPDFWSSDPNATHLYETINLPVLFGAASMPPAYDHTGTVTYASVNGEIAGFPGTFIGTAPPTFDAATGLDTGSGFTGDTVVLTNHDISVPEPASSWLVLASLSLLSILLRKGARGPRGSSV